MNTPISADEKRWRAENDAYTLAEAQTISKDPIRMKAATEAAARMAEEQRKKANAMSSVAKKKGSTISVKNNDNSFNRDSKPNKTSVAKGKISKFNVFERI